MRQSPSKVVFNYGHQELLGRRYSPEVVQSGYILGQPISYNNLAQLPNNYHTFSPSRSRPRASTDFITSSRIAEYEAPDPSRFAPPPSRPSLRLASPPKITNHVIQSPVKVESRGIPESEYNQLLHKYNNLDHRYKELEQRYFELQNQSRIRSGSYSQSDIVPLIERYKSNLLNEFKLLMDRARLQEKESELYRR